MKVVLPVHKKRISPVFDWSMRALVVDVLAENAVKHEEFDLSHFTDMERIHFIKNLGTGALLCGGISLQLEGIISVLGIDVISWITGSVDEILNGYIRGTLNPEKYLMPGVRRYLKNKRIVKMNQKEESDTEYNFKEWKDNEQFR